MRFADVIGNAEVARSLVSMADSGRVAHAMLMYENEGCGAMALRRPMTNRLLSHI